jgi:hypothetical protein
MRSKLPIVLLTLAALAGVVFYSFQPENGSGEIVSATGTKRTLSVKEGSGEVSSHVPGVRTPKLSPSLSRERGALTEPLLPAGQWHPGMPATAVVEVGGRKTPTLHLNQAGEFPRVYIAPKQSVRVSVALPTAEIGGKVVASLEDGGELEGGRPVNVMTVNSERIVSFAFTAGAAAGRYRVVLRHQGESKVVVLWAALDAKTAAN